MPVSFTLSTMYWQPPCFILFPRKKTAVVISGVSSREKRAKNMNLYVKQICCRCRCNWLEGEASFPHTHTQQIVQIEEKEVCKCTKPPNKSNETFPYQIAVNIQCSLTFSCMCSLFCVYISIEQRNFSYICFFTRTRCHSRKTCKRLHYSWKANMRNNNKNQLTKMQNNGNLHLLRTKKRYCEK